MKLLIASNNAGKLREFKEILSPYYAEILTPKDLGLSIEVEENGKTFEENALTKARAFSNAAHMDAIADDSGLCVDALDGAPGVYSARYAGEHGDDDANNRLLLQNLIGVPDEARTARFVCGSGPRRRPARGVSCMRLSGKAALAMIACSIAHSTAAVTRN